MAQRLNVLVAVLVGCLLGQSASALGTKFWAPAISTEEANAADFCTIASASGDGCPVCPSGRDLEEMCTVGGGRHSPMDSALRVSVMGCPPARPSRPSRPSVQPPGRTDCITAQSWAHSPRSSPGGRVAGAAGRRGFAGCDHHLVPSPCDLLCAFCQPTH